MKFNKPERINIRHVGAYNKSVHQSYVILVAPNDRIMILHERWEDEGKPGKISRYWDLECGKNRWIENFQGTLNYMSIGDKKLWLL